MSTYQPGIPTGTVNLDVDYQNIQANFQQLDTSFGVDHVPFSNQTAQNGYHKSIHFNPISTTSTNPPNNQPVVPPSTIGGFGQLFSSQINDGIANDQALYFLSGGGRLSQLTRNFAPVAAQDGRTFLPGGLILQWFFVATPANTTTYNYPLAFPTACYNIQVTAITNDNSTIRCTINTGSVTRTGFQLQSTASSHFTGMYVLAIGI